ncbi:aldo/keto reductase [Mycetocola tolaasinivorans]|uniref:Aldo/keto reductase n=1 Tax=Mycetocola tolaasinivorans TaxID=76635 RepID=A0A3L7A3V8_9MICO|nr:aldo/keto reductase [Mycetocola tolaasinivorans]RLP74735.1 aldo/keto reductase [Mycetocola tolaasinivorans]
MTSLPVIPLNDGHRVPALGFGTYPLTGPEGVTAIASALGVGYRMLDTAVNYKNETEVGEALRVSGVARRDITLTSKLPGRDHGYDETLRSFEGTIERLGVEKLDLYLIHWPNPSVNRFVDTWKAMIRLREEGRVASIGVSNFTEDFLTRLAAETGVLPAVNQVELHPYFPQEALLEFHREHGIATEAWSPLGKRAKPHEEAVIGEIAERHGVTPAQAVLRWHIERGVIPIPKSATPARQAQNLDIFGFELDEADIAAITALGRPDGRLFDGDPNTHEEM